MSDSKGAFIAIEGSDGSGKTTQFGLLKQRLENAGYETAVFKFPQYNQPSSHFIKQYLNGAYGPASNVNPYTASLFYALDRYEAAPSIKQALAQGKIVLADRYAGSNMAHQGSKFLNPAERRGFFVWAESIEFQMLGIPRPNINLLLRVPAEKSFELTKARAPRDYTNRSQDEHEKDLNHLKSTVETYDMLCQLFAVDFKAIECLRDGELMPVEEIHSLVWQAIEPLLPPLGGGQPKPAKPKPSLSKKPVAPTKNIINSGDEAEWQVDGISLIAAFGLQQAGLNVSLDFDSSWSGSKTAYKYSVPEGLNESARQKYTSGYDSAVEMHKKLYEKIAALNASKPGLRRALRLVTPMGAVFSASVKIDKSRAGAALEKLRAQPNQEIATLLNSLTFALDEKTKPITENNKLSSKTAPESINDILDKISVAKQDYGADLEPLQIIEFNPRNEFELIADTIYPRSSLTREEILLALDRLTYEQKAGELKKALSSELVMQLPTYRFDALTDWLTLSAVLGSDLAEVIHAQQLTTRYGYEVPPEVESEGLEDLYMDIFDLFLGLYSELQKEYDEDITQYTTLAGNKLRWQGRTNARALRSGMVQTDNDLTAFSEQLVGKVTELHPLISAEIRPAAKKIAAKRARSSSGKK